MTTEEETASKEISNDGLDSFECSLCQIAFNDRNALYRHRRREHVLETNVTLGESSCNKQFKKVDTFKKHMASCHTADVQVAVYDNEYDQVRKKRKMMSPSFDLKTGSRLALASNEQALIIKLWPSIVHL
ncbi:hypothetical protein BX666DRAFT_2023112 [Dichotomocladium elegans]|nr:hypothetical protein BX666DRAFT_2023112 [Dichotomocladium elegans]